MRQLQQFQYFNMIRIDSNTYVHKKYTLKNGSGKFSITLPFFLCAIATFAKIIDFYTIS
jgi:hypothetical protein